MKKNNKDELTVQECHYGLYHQFSFLKNTNLFCGKNLIYTNLETPQFSYTTYPTSYGFYEVFSESNSTKVLYTAKENFKKEKIIDIYTPQSLVCFDENRITKRYNYIQSKFYLSRTTSKVLYANDKYINHDRETIEYKTMEKFYPKISFLIPYFDARNALDNILTIIHHSIATQKIDFTTLSANLEHLRTLEFCYSSVSLLDKFFQSPDSCDLQNLCESLSKSRYHINQIIQINDGKILESFFDEKEQNEL